MNRFLDFIIHELNQIDLDDWSIFVLTATICLQVVVYFLIIKS